MPDERTTPQADKKKSRPIAETDTSVPEDALIDESPLLLSDTARILRLQRIIGNTAVQRLLDEQKSSQTAAKTRKNPANGFMPHTAEMLQRQDVTADATEQQLNDFLGKRYITSTENFDIDYDPTNGNPVTVRPANGTVKVTLKLHINFKNFTRDVRSQEPYNTIRFTPAQRADFTWKAAEKTTFNQDMVSSIQNAWSGAHRMQANEPGYEQVSAGVNVEVKLVNDPAKAHCRVTAQKIPAGAPRFRSYVSGDASEATLDWRDPTEEETDDVDVVFEQAYPFDHGKADVAPIQAQLDAFIQKLDNYPVPNPAFTNDYSVHIVGRSTSSGSSGVNDRLAERRAQNVQDYIDNNNSRGYKRSAWGEGETGTTDADEFRRVDLSIVRDDGNTQNVAAHEAGHMFGIGDEYQDTEEEDDAGRGRFAGDEPSHYDDVKDELGVGAADDVLVGNTDSLMASGGEVKKGHYVYFLKSLESATGIQWDIP